MITQLLAHAGEAHETVAEATAHSEASTAVMWLILLLTPFVLIVITHILMKQKFTVSALVIGLFLIAFSVYSYQSPGIYTAVSLVAGFFLVFILMFAGLTAKD